MTVSFTAARYPLRTGPTTFIVVCRTQFSRTEGRTGPPEAGCGTYSSKGPLSSDVRTFSTRSQVLLPVVGICREALRIADKLWKTLSLSREPRARRRPACAVGDAACPSFRGTGQAKGSNFLGTRLCNAAFGSEFQAVSLVSGGSEKFHFSAPAWATSEIEGAPLHAGSGYSARVNTVRVVAETSAQRCTHGHFDGGSVLFSLFRINRRASLILCLGRRPERRLISSCVHDSSSRNIDFFFLRSF